ncbi:DsbA family protein [Natrialbaceae archaeon A-CW3]
MSLDQPSRRAVLAGAVLALGGGGAYYLARAEDGPDHVVEPEIHASDGTSELGVELRGKPILGSPDAPLEIYYWTDFQCPFCAQFEHETLPALVRDHVEPGQVRMVVIPLPYFGEDSMTSAVASRCVFEQARGDDPSTYWDWHAAVIDAQGERNSGWAGADNLVEITRSVDGVDAEGLEACLDEERSTYEGGIEADAGQARSFGVTGTPTSAVFDPEAERVGTLVGAQPPERFDEAIDRIENE